ncbi:MAG: ParA family protein [Chloroflexi bacterium]|nr:ParA family protein [Chloroflexota bacterium]
MTRILVLANQKGGVGKTTTVFNLGVALAGQGRRVLLVDIDPQASLTALMGFDPYKIERSSYSLLMFDGMGLARALKTPRANLALVPGSIDLATAAVKLVQERHPLTRLRDALRQSRMLFDTVLLDTPPGLNVLTVAGFLAADSVVIPAQCDHLAMLGVRAIQDMVARVCDGLGNADLSLCGVLATFFDPQAIYAQKTLDELRALVPVLETVIPYDVHIADAPHQGKPVLDYAPDSPGAAAYRKLAEEVGGWDA